VKSAEGSPELPEHGGGSGKHWTACTSGVLTLQVG